MPNEINADWLRPAWEALNVRAFMTTRSGGVSAAPFESMNIGRSVGDLPEAVATNRRHVSDAVGAPAVFMPQVHGAGVLVLTPEHTLPDADLPPHDAAVSTRRDVAVAIQVADCLPVLFAAPGGVGGAHAGWRGLAGGVLENTVATLCREANCRPEQVRAWMGACIGPEAFEVGADVLAAFGVAATPQSSSYFRFQRNEAGEPRWRADLAGLARQRLLTLGLQDISGGGWCTWTETSRFFSYRRARVSGRMAAAIALR